MTIQRAYMLNDIQTPKDNIYRCHGCGSIYRSSEQNPKCPKGQGRCTGTIQRATARYVG